MTADWQILYPYEGSDLDIDGYVRNIAGNPVKSATRLDQEQTGFGSPPAGIYIFRFSSQTELSCLNPDRKDLRNTWTSYFGNFNEEPRTVICDGTTQNLNVLPGWSFTFSELTQPGDEFLANLGGFFDGSAPIRALSFGSRVSGLTDSEKVLKIKNVSGITQTACSLVVTNAIRVENSNGHPSKPILCFYQSGSSNPIADTDTSGFQVTFANWTAGTPPTVDVLIAGETVGVVDDADSLIPYGTGLKCDGTTIYRFADGTKWQSGTFTLSPDLEESDTAQIYVSDGGDQIELAQPSEPFTLGCNGIELTQSGQDAGTILNNGTVSARLRTNPRIGLDSSLNPRAFSLRPVGMKDATATSRDYQGTFWIEDMDLQKSLVWRIQAILGQYKMPRYSLIETPSGPYVLDATLALVLVSSIQHYSINPTPPPDYIADPAGLYVYDPANPTEMVLLSSLTRYNVVSDHPTGLYIEDPQNPGNYVLASEGPSQGHYDSIADILAANGVTFPSQ